MSRRGKLVQICARLLAGLMGLFLLLMLALPIAAASEKVEDVLAILNQLQGSHIQYEWLPDIEANQSLVEELLGRYQGLNADERAELTAEQNTHLRGYFEALYQLQGKPATEVDALFEAAPAASSPEVESISQAPESVASVPETDRSIAPPPQSANGKTSLPVFQNPPQTPRGDGWFSFFANQGLGTALLVVLVLLAVVLFIRFVVALRKAPRPTADDTDAEARAAELFGENYADSELIDMDALEKASHREKELKAAAEAADRLAEEGAEGLGFEDLEDLETLADNSQPEEAVRRGGFFGRFRKKAGDGEAGDEAKEAEERETEEAGPSFWNSKAVSSLDGRPKIKGAAKPEKPAEGTFATNVPALKRTVSLPDPQLDEPVKKAVETIGKNPDRTDSIVMRGFTPKPPNGKPGKMPFRQGDPDDLDAIDD